MVIQEFYIPLLALIHPLPFCNQCPVTSIKRHLFLLEGISSSSTETCGAHLYLFMICSKSFLLFPLPGNRMRSSRSGSYDDAHDSSPGVPDAKEHEFMINILSSIKFSVSEIGEIPSLFSCLFFPPLSPYTLLFVPPPFLTRRCSLSTPLLIYPFIHFPVILLSALAAP